MSAHLLRFTQIVPSFAHHIANLTTFCSIAARTFTLQVIKLKKNSTIF